MTRMMRAIRRGILSDKSIDTRIEILLKENPKTTTIELLLMKLCHYLEDKPIFRDITLIDDTALMGPRSGFEFFFERVWETVTFAYFRARLRRAWKYAKRGYNTFDFDSAYAMDDFIWKLNRLATVIDKYGHHVRSDSDVRRIRHTTALLKKVMDDEYYWEETKFLDDRYGKISFDFERKDGRITRDRPGQTPENAEYISKLERRAMERSIERRKQDFSQALGLIEKYFWHWWD